MNQILPDSICTTFVLYFLLIIICTPLQIRTPLLDEQLLLAPTMSVFEEGKHISMEFLFNSFFKHYKLLYFLFLYFPLQPKLRMLLFSKSKKNIQNNYF